MYIEGITIRVTLTPHIKSYKALLAGSCMSGKLLTRKVLIGTRLLGNGDTNYLKHSR